ncbi:hypothetical protein ACHAQA_006046 [Verticillium albo-atrum]
MSSPGAKPRRENRRSHRKSRNGCLTCKRRRVKCDEQRPRCERCTFGDRICSYRPSNNSEAGVSTPGTAASLLGSNPHASTTEHGVRISGASGGAFTVLHMSLLHHAHTNLADIISLSGDTGIIIDTAIANAVEAPYLLDQLLAISALHQSTRVDDAEVALLYHQEATEMQTRALGVFNEMQENIPESHSVSALLFATLLGVQVLQGVLSGPERPFVSLVTDFVGYVRLHNGVRAVIDGWWPRILESNLEPLLYLLKWTADPRSLMGGTETVQILSHLESSSASSPRVAEACIAAAEWVQWVLGVIALEPSRTDLAVQAVLAWPLLVPDDYIHAVYQHRPEALVVLAHYGALLHLLRQFWVFGDSGAMLVKSIADQVGPFWTEALAWPQKLISDTDTTHVFE